MGNNKRYLPESNNLYSISPTGEVFESNKLLPILNGEVKLKWVLGERNYSVGALVTVVFSEIQIPLNLFDEIEPLYKNGDSNDNSAGNVFYRFRNGPLGVPELPGFYYIPFHTGYCINEHGVMMNIKSLRVKTWAIMKPGRRNSTGGYKYSRVVTDHKKSVCLFLHRALCYTFKKYGNNLHELVPNHLDGKPWNNGLPNLEWSTYSENNQHAHDHELRPNSTFPVLARNVATGESWRFPSMVAAGTGTGVSTMVVYWRIRKCPGKVFGDMLQFKIDDGLPWPETNLDPAHVCRVGAGGDIVAINIFSGDKIIFTGCGAGERLTGVKSSTILYHVRNKPSTPISGYIFRYLNEADSIPKYTDKHLKIFARYPHKPPKGIVATNVSTGEELFFESREIAAEHFGVVPGYIAAFANNKRLYDQKYRFSYFDPSIV